MADDDQQVSEYTVTIGGIEHTMMLTAEDAKRYGDDAKKGAADNKAKAPANKSKS